MNKYIIAEFMVSDLSTENSQYLTVSKYLYDPRISNGKYEHALYDAIYTYVYICAI